MDGVVFQLTAMSPQAQEFSPKEGNCNLRLRPETKIGRKVSRHDGHCLPASWVQVSSYHCQLKWDQEARHFMVTDTSTNGTYINSKRIPKNGSAPLKEGDMLRLSFVPDSNDKAKLIEYRLETISEAVAMAAVTTAPPKKVTQPTAASPQENRPENGQDSVQEPPTKKKRTEMPEDGEEAAELSAMARLQKTNQDLTRKLESTRAEVQRLEAKVEANAAEAERQSRLAQENQLKAVEAERFRSKEASEASMAALKTALEKGKDIVAELEEKLAKESSARIDSEKKTGDLTEKLQSAHAAEAKMNSELEALKEEVKRSLEEKCKTDRLFKDLQKEMEAVHRKHEGETSTAAHLRQELDIEKANLAQAQHDLKLMAEDLEQQKSKAESEASARQLAETAQAMLKQSLNQAVRQNERAEEGQQHALDYSAVQTAYLQKVLNIAKHLNDSRKAEEAARVVADQARRDSDQALKDLQVQVTSALGKSGGNVEKAGPFGSELIEGTQGTRDASEGQMNVMATQIQVEVDEDATQMEDDEALASPCPTAAPGARWSPEAKDGDMEVIESSAADETPTKPSGEDSKVAGSPNKEVMGTDAIPKTPTTPKLGGSPSGVNDGTTAEERNTPPVEEDIEVVDKVEGEQHTEKDPVQTSPAELEQAEGPCEHIPRDFVPMVTDSEDPTAASPGPAATPRKAENDYPAAAAAPAETEHAPQQAEAVDEPMWDTNADAGAPSEAAQHLSMIVAEEELGATAGMPELDLRLEPEGATTPVLVSEYSDEGDDELEGME